MYCKLYCKHVSCNSHVKYAYACIQFSVSFFCALVINLCDDQDESDEMTAEVRQLITSYNNIVSFAAAFCVLHTIGTGVPFGISVFSYC